MLRADVGSFKDSHDRTSSDYRLSVAGGLGYAAGTLGFGRPITDSFGIVKVGEVAGVAVTLNAQPMGTTNDQGVVFLPALPSYSDSEVALVNDTVPIEYSLAALTKKISPSLRSGALIDFGVVRVQALTGRLKYPPGVAGKSLDLRDVTLMVDEKATRYRTGRAGEFYLENLSPGTYAGTVELEGAPCRFGLVVPKSHEVFVDLGDVICR
jgi:outer membrane usher protein FimD/PapC